MSLLGIDVGTTGCKVAACSLEGKLLASAYQEYDVARPRPGWAELDTAAVWQKVQDAIRQVAAACRADPVTALSVSSLGEALVPVSAGRTILGPSLLNFDQRGEEYLPELARRLDDHRLFAINGNTLGNHYSLTKLRWIREHQPELYRRTDLFLLWGSFVAFMLGADPVVDYSLANRTLLFDINSRQWSPELLAWAGLEREKLPQVAPSATQIGRVSRRAAAGLGLRPQVAIVTGAHDQCANAVGCGVIAPGQAMYGMGTYICIAPVYGQVRDPRAMIERGLNTEHHAVPGRFVSFIYNQGGALCKWFRDTFASLDRERARERGEDIYAQLLAEIPERPSQVMVLPHFTSTGPPRFIADSCGVMAGLRLETTRGEILKGILEGTTFYLRQCVDSLPPTGIQITGYRAVGGGSKSDAWVQVCADILGRPFVRPRVTEAGTLGAAIMAGAGSGAFPSLEAGVQAMVALDRTFHPDPRRQALYDERFERYTRLGPLMEAYLRELAAGMH